jgi:hypothetical protein
MILTKIIQSATFALGESGGEFFASSRRPVNISLVIGLCCLAMSSSFSHAKILLVHMFV